jgi:uncharacterized protein
MKSLCFAFVASWFVATSTLAQESGETTSLVCDAFRAEAERRLDQAPDSLQVNILLFSAAQKGCVNMLDRLMAAGASLQARNRLGDMPLAVAAKAGRKEFVAQLAHRGADLNSKNVEGATPLLLAAQAGRKEVALQLIDAGADVNLADLRGETPLIVSAYNRDATVAERLLARKADPKPADATGKPAIVYAAAKGAKRIVQMLLDAGVDVNATYDANLTVLMWAAGHADNAPEAEGLSTVSLLIERGARVNERDDRGRTPLMIAVGQNHVDIARALMTAGADASLRDNAGKSAADLAATDDARAVVLSH